MSRKVQSKEKYFTNNNKIAQSRDYDSLKLKQFQKPFTLIEINPYIFSGNSQSHHKLSQESRCGNQ